MNNPKRKMIGVILIIMILYTVFMLMMFKNNKPKQQESAYLILNNNVNYKYTDGRFEKVSNQQIEDEALNYDVYVDSIFKGNYYLRQGTVWNLFDKDYNYEYYDGEIFAISENSKINLEFKKARNLTEYEKEIVYNYITRDLKDTIQEVYDIDINNDMNNDKLIVISNYDDSIENNISLIIAIIDGKQYTIVNKKGKNVVYSFKFVMNTSNASYLVIEQITNPDGDIESLKTKYNIYNFDDGKLKKIN